MIKTGLLNTQILLTAPLDCQSAYDFSDNDWAVRVGFDVRDDGGFFYTAIPTRLEDGRLVFENHRLRRKWSLDYSELNAMLIFHAEDFGVPPDVLGGLYNLWREAYDIENMPTADMTDARLLEDMRRGYVRYTYHGSDYADAVSRLLARGILRCIPGNPRAAGTDFMDKYQITMKGREWLYWLDLQKVAVK